MSIVFCKAVNHCRLECSSLAVKVCDNCFLAELQIGTTSSRKPTRNEFLAVMMDRLSLTLFLSEQSRPIFTYVLEMK